MESLADKTKDNPALRSLLAQSWMLLLGLFWLVRFMPLKTEAFWLLKLQVYRGDETASLVKVSLARDGVLSLVGALVFLIPFLTKLIKYFRNNRKQSNQRMDPTMKTPVE